MLKKKQVCLQVKKGLNESILASRVNMRMALSFTDQKENINQEIKSHFSLFSNVVKVEQHVKNKKDFYVNLICLSVQLNVIFLQKK